MNEYSVNMYVMSAL